MPPVQTILDLVQSLSVGICALGADGRIQFANAHFGEMAGAAPESLAGEPVKDIFFTMPTNGHANQPYRTWLRRASGDPVGVLVVPKRTEDGSLHLVVLPEELLSSGLLGQAMDQVRRTELIADRLEQAWNRPTASSFPPPAERDLGESPMLALLSRREREIVSSLVAARPVKQIAKSLNISPHTVRNHLKSSFRKLNVGSQVELVAKLSSHSSAPPLPPPPATPGEA